MRASDVMTRRVVCVHPATPVEDAVRLMIRHRVGGLPVVDGNDVLVGIVTESDLLHRFEAGADKHDRNWLALLISPRQLAQDFRQAEAQAVSEIMTTDVATVGPEAALAVIVDVMEQRQVKRVAVVANGKLNGIVSRADLLKAISRIAHKPVQVSDEQIRDALLAQVDRRAWASATCIDADVRKGIVTLRGIVFNGQERAALHALAGNLAGVRGIEDQLIWVDPAAGLGLDEPKEAHGPDAETTNEPRGLYS